LIFENKRRRLSLLSGVLYLCPAALEPALFLKCSNIGRLWFESTLGKVAVFFFTLPKSILPASAGMPTIVPAPSLRVRTEPETTRGFSGVYEEAASEAPAASARQPEASPASEETEQLRLLVVDDEVVNQQVLNQRIGPIIQKNGGFINQYLGDGIMAIFRNNPENALRAAVEMQETLRQYNHKRLDQNRRPIQIGVGMHTGPLIMGIIGDQKRLDATTVADTVNTASRLEGLTKFYHADILLSRRSLDLMPDAGFGVRYLGQAQMKGKTAYIGVYECFDGDNARQIAHKSAVQAEFARGLEACFHRDFEAAADTFRNITALNPEDKPAQLFLEKALHCAAADALPEGWTGVELMGQK
jgi:class 3 adenylate cyclase